MKRTRKGWNGGSIESAMQYAREMRDKAIEQGATLCDECKGEGGSANDVCDECKGAGCLIPPGGLHLPTPSVKQP